MTDLVFRTATRDDLPAMIAMIADDQLGRARDDASLPLDPRYIDAFAAIERDPNQMLVVVEQGGVARADRVGARRPGEARRRPRVGHV